MKYSSLDRPSAGLFMFLVSWKFSNWKQGDVNSEVFDKLVGLEETSGAGDGIE